MAIKPIQLLITAKDEASAVFSSLQTKVMAVGAVIASYFGIQAFGGAVQGAADLESTLSRVQHATGASAEEMARLKATAQDAGMTTSFSATQAAEAMENLGKAGLNGQQVIAALPAVLNLASAANQDLALTADQVVSAVMGMGLQFEDAGRVADVLTKGADSTKTSVGGLSQALSYAAPVANSLGLSLESTVAILGQFAQGGIDASRAGTALNSILSQFSNPASKFRQELAAAGITTTNFEKALHQLAAAGPAGSKAINAVGQEAGPALRAMLNQGMGALDQLTASLRDAEGSAAATAKAMRDNLNGSLTSLGNVWTSVKNVFSTPVLPVIKDGVDQLVDALRSAVADGTVARFGETIATGFRNAIAWTRQFAGSFNWEELRGRMQLFADEVSLKFDQIGQYATNASNAVQLGWGVMTAGANTVMMVIYRIGEAFAGVASNINAGAALIAEGLAKITFGDVSKRFVAMAQEMRTEAGAFWAASEALAQKAQESLNVAAEGATLARDAYAALRGEVEEAGGVVSSALADIGAKFADVGAAALDAAKKVVSSADQQAKAAEAAKEKVKALIAEYNKAISVGNWERANKVMQEIGRATDAAAEASRKAAEASARQAQAATETKAKIEALRAEYERAVDAGNWQRAAEVIQQLGATTQKAAASVEDLDAALQRAGVQTTEELKRMAEVARQDFELIKQSGKVAADGVSEAWRRAADAAIRANNGIAPSWVQAEASIRGYTVATDAAGKASLRAADDVDRATRKMAHGWDSTTASIARSQQAAEAFAAFQKRMQDLYGRAGESPTIGKIERTNTTVQGSQDLMNQWIIKNLGEQFLGDERAAKVYGTQSILEEWRRLGVNKDYDGSMQAMYAELARLKSELEAERTDGRAASRQRPTGSTLTESTAPTGSSASSGGISTGPQSSLTANYITIDNKTYNVPSTSKGSGDLADLLRAVGASKKASVH